MSKHVVDFPQKPVRGESPMIEFDRWMMIKSLYRQGWAKRKIARELVVDRNTVRKVLRQERPQPYQRVVPRSSILAPYEGFIQQRVAEVDYSARRVFEDLLTMGYQGSYDTVKVYVRPLRQERDQIAEATVRFETAPGKQAQVDWGSSWVTMQGGRLRVHLFVMGLGYSRRHYVEFTPRETIEELILCHEHAFDWFGGLTEEILYDNPKTVVLKRDVEGKHIQWNPLFWDFAGYYGFTPRLCRPYRAKTKGKVESGMKYVKRSFLSGREFASWEHLNECAQRWTVEVADSRIHGTTHRSPAEAFREEKLLSHRGKPPFRVQNHLLRKVSHDCLVMIETNRYSVPYRYVGKTVEIQWDKEGTLSIYYRGKQIASHPRQNGQHRVRVDPVHYQGLLQAQRQASTPPTPQGNGKDLRLWRVVDEPVQIRDLSIYEALVT